MKNIRLFLSENYQVLEVKLSIYLNRRVFVMCFKFRTSLVRCQGARLFWVNVEKKIQKMKTAGISRSNENKNIIK